MQKIIAIFAPQLHQNVAKNTDCLDISGHFRRYISVRHWTGFFPFWTYSFYFNCLRCTHFFWFHQYLKFQRPQKTNSAEQYQHFYKRFVARFIGLLATQFIWRNWFSWERYWAVFSVTFDNLFVYCKLLYSKRRQARKICRQTPLNSQRFFLSETVPSWSCFFMVKT